MIRVYEIKANGFLGGFKDIDPSEGIGLGWTYDAPPSDAPHRWEAGEWIPCEELPYSPASGVDTTQAAESVRADRDARLAATDWTQLKDVPAEVSQKWAAYRQALRDVPEQMGFPLAIDWPVAPT